MSVHSIWDKCGYMIHVDVRIAGCWTGATVRNGGNVPPGGTVGERDEPFMA